MTYDTLDAAILTAIGSGKDKFYIINASVEHLARPHCIKENGAFRVVDRRLQALSKRGLIQYWRGKWRIAERVDANT